MGLSSISNGVFSGNEFFQVSSNAGDLEFQDTISDVPLKDQLKVQESVRFERDERRDEHDVKVGGVDDENVVSTEFNELFASNKSFRNAVMSALDNGVRIQFRLNADDNRVTLVNGDVLQVDIRSDADITKELKSVFNSESDWDVEPPGDGPSFEEVMADDSITGEEFVAHMERLNIFSFSGEHGGKIRKDVVHLYDDSPFMKYVMRSTLEQSEGEQKFNFSTIGQGGGTISRPFDDFATNLNSKAKYEGVSTEDYNPEDNSAGVWTMAHEMCHSFLSMSDSPVIDIAGEIFGNDLGPTGERSIAYDDELLGARLTLNSEFDVAAFIEASRDGGLNGKSHQEILDQFGGGNISLSAIKDEKGYMAKMNHFVGLVREKIKKTGEVPALKGELAKIYKQLLDYNIRTFVSDGGNSSVEDMGGGGGSDIMDMLYPESWAGIERRTRNDLLNAFSLHGDEAQVFEEYADSSEGSKVLEGIAQDAWDQAYDTETGTLETDESTIPDDVENTIGQGVWPL